MAQRTTSGRSAAGKSTVARALRKAYGRGVAWVSQDLIRRIILKEKDQPGAVNIGLIDQVARYSLDHGYHVVLDGIFYADRYELILSALNRDHLGVSRFYYLDVSMDEALRRHAMRPQAAEFGPDDMRAWYRPGDLLTKIREHVIPETQARERFGFEGADDDGTPLGDWLRADDINQVDVVGIAAGTPAEGS